MDTIPAVSFGDEQSIKMLTYSWSESGCCERSEKWWDDDVFDQKEAGEKIKENVLGQQPVEWVTITH